MRAHAAAATPGSALPVAFQVFRSVGLPIWATLGAVLALAVTAKVRFGIPWHYTMGDPATTVGWPFYVGFVSNTGAMAWTATASIFLFRFYTHRTAGGDARWGRFLLWSGAFVALLGLDDLFLLHDQAFPKYLSIGQPVILAIYGLLAGVYLLRFAPQIARTAFPVFLLAFALLGSSVALDQMQDHLSIYPPGSGFLEDALKLLGIGTWLSYAIHTCASAPPADAGVRIATPPRHG